MKRNKILFPVALAITAWSFNACYDDKMEWGHSYGNVSPSEIPLSLTESLANYDFIKNYAKQYVPHMTIGLGFGADLYLTDAAYKQVVDDNFQIYTTGNAMKHSSVVNSKGEYNFATIDAFLAAVPDEKEVYGHNYIWHAQQPAKYLNSLIAPEIIPPSPGSNLVDISGLQDGSFTGWNKANQVNGSISIVDGQGLTAADPAIKFVVTSSSSQEWDTQLESPTIIGVEGHAYSFSFWIRSEEEASFRLSFNDAVSNRWPWYDGKAHVTTGPEWKKVSYGADGSLTINGAAVKMFFDMGKSVGTYYVDINSIEVTDLNAEPASAKALANGPTVIEKPDEEKKAILLEAMESWIKTMAGHCKHRVKAWDVLNEAISDGGTLRGVDFVPPASEMGDDEFYWGQYIGKDYGLKAFQFARQYGNPDDKLYINDYNLETNPRKLDAFLEYVKYIDQANGAPIVDGVGTQMHVEIKKISREQIDEMFKKMAASGKLVRVTELDVKVGSATPTSGDLELQAQVYQMVMESYLANVPVAQQSGVTVWTLTDHKREHVYWIPDDAPNLFDAKYTRKHAYKNFCDGIAGYDISTDFNGEDWRQFYDGNE